MDIFSATLLSIANLFIVEPNQGLFVIAQKSVDRYLELGLGS